MRRKNTTSEMMKNYISQSLLILLEKKVLSDISIKEITDKAGVNRATYYRHFTSREQIIKYYYINIFSQYITTINDAKEIGTAEYLLGMFSHLKKYKSQLLLIHQNGASHLILDALNELFIQNDSLVSLDFEFAANYHIGGIYGTFLLWFTHKMQESPAQMCEASIKILPENFSPMLLRK